MEDDTVAARVRELEAELEMYRDLAGKPCKCDPPGSGEELCNTACELAQRLAEVERLRGALTKLMNESNAVVGLDREGLRHLIGNTNLNCFVVRINEADAALHHAGRGEGVNMDKNVWVELNPVERKRRYQYGENEAYTFANVCRIKVTDSGHHYLQTTYGKKYILAPGWNYLEIDADEWTV